MSRFETKVTWVKKARQVHGNKYDYSGSIYINSKSKLTIVCPIHGKFEQEPRIHTSGKGCMPCGRARTGSLVKGPRGPGIGQKEFVKRAGMAHAYKYNYPNQYEGHAFQMKVLCPEHGAFSVWPGAHLQGGAVCPGCKEKQRAARMRKKERQLNAIRIAARLKRQEDRAILDAERDARRKDMQEKRQQQAAAVWKVKRRKSWCQVVDKARRIHNNAYIYHEPKEYKGGLHIECPMHGNFSQNYRSHLHQGAGCDKCAKNRASVKLTRSTQHFIELGTKKYNGAYTYEKARYTGKNNYVIVTCPSHGDFEVLAQNHMHYKTNYGGCSECRPKVCKSSIEAKVARWVGGKTEVITSDRTQLNGWELDVYAPSHRLGVEVNGIYWHSERYKDNDYHYLKALRARRAGITLLQFWEHELNTKTRVCKSIINNHLGLNLKKFARKLRVCEIVGREKTDWFDANHLQGSARSSVCYGLFEDNECLAAMSFGAPRFNSQYQWEIVRFANALNTTVVGGASRLWAHFVKTHQPRSVVSYADLRISQGKLYRTLGFRLSHRSAPGYFWHKGALVLSRHQTQKHKLKSLLGSDFVEKESEKTNMERLGWSRVFDAGNLAFVFEAQIKS